MITQRNIRQASRRVLGRRTRRGQGVQVRNQAGRRQAHTRRCQRRVHHGTGYPFKVYIGVVVWCCCCCSSSQLTVDNNCVVTATSTTAMRSRRGASGAMLARGTIYMYLCRLTVTSLFLFPFPPPVFPSFRHCQG